MTLLEEHSLKVRETVKFKKVIGVGSTVVFHSTSIDLQPNPGSVLDNTSFNLLTIDDDYLLHISIRRPENAIVFNSRTQAGKWGKEERIPLFGVFQQTDATVSVRIHEKTFGILVDDTLVKTYEKRISKDAQGATYAYNNGTRSVFSDIITVTVADASDPVPPASTAPSKNYQQAYFPLKAVDLAEESKTKPFDIVIIGSGIGGGVLATDLLEKNKRLTASTSHFTAQSTKRCMSSNNASGVTAQAESDDKSLRILVVERGGLVFNTHSLNMPRPTNRGTYGQMNDLFYNHFKERWDMDDATKAIWAGGPVYCLGGRSTVWGLFSPRMSNDTFSTRFPTEVYNDLEDIYLRKAEETMNLSYPQTLPLHRELIDKLNLRERDSRLPTTQWEWGRIASEFHNAKNFDFAEGAYSTVDRLLEAAMDDPSGQGKFKTLINSPVSRLEPQPEAGKTKTLSHVVIKDASGEHKISTKKAVVCAGAVDSAALLLRSAQGKSKIEAFGESFNDDFGHVTDHYIFFVTLPFFYRNMANKDVLGGMKLQTDITFKGIDNTTALANISVDASSFLPRRNVPDSELPQFIIAYILPSKLAHKNNISLNKDQEPRLKIGYAEESELDAKKEVLMNFAVDVMNKVAAVLDVQFVNHDHPSGDYVPMEKVTKDKIKLGTLGPGGVAHEMGSIPMPNKQGQNGIVDKDLKMSYGWDNVYVCDLSVFPYSPAANPTLSLAALALRLSDHLLPPKETLYQPIIVYNLTKNTVYVCMTLSDSKSPSFGGTERQEIKSGQSVAWKRVKKESIFVYASQNSRDFNVQLVEPGINAMIVTDPPKDSAA